MQQVKFNYSNFSPSTILLVVTSLHSYRSCLEVGKRSLKGHVFHTIFFFQVVRFFGTWSHVSSIFWCGSCLFYIIHCGLMKVVSFFMKMQHVVLIFLIRVFWDFFIVTCLIFCLNFAGLFCPLPCLVKEATKKHYFLMKKWWGRIGSKFWKLSIQNLFDLDFCSVFLVTSSQSTIYKRWVFGFCLFMQGSKIHFIFILEVGE